MKKLMEMIKLTGMKKNKIGLDKALENSGDFLAFLGQEARSEEYGKLKEHARKNKAHPTGGMLYDYALGRTDEKDTMKIRNHISFCDDCSDEVLRIMGIEGDLEEEAAGWANKGDLEEEAAKWAGPPIVVSVPHEFLWAGKFVTAADIPEQSHTFMLNDDKFTLTCRWMAACKNTSAYISVLWNADIEMVEEILLRFLNPETDERYAELSLGADLTGEETFESDDLGFDPSNQRWAVCVVLI